MSHALRLPDAGMTVEEFLDWEGDGYPYLHQLIDGEPVAMAAPSVTHGRLQARLARLLGNHLAEHRPNCEAVVTPGVQPRVDAKRNLRVPDLVVACDLGRARLLTAPLVIAEFLSPSNKRETREAVRACLTIPSLQEVLVLHTETIAAELLRRGDDGAWPAEPEPFGPGETFVLESLAFECATDALYADNA